MDLIDEYYEKLKSLIEEAQLKGVDIRAYNTYVDNENKTTIDQGICIIRGNEHKDISTWKL